jgi:hypothetical protein
LFAVELPGRSRPAPGVVDLRRGTRVHHLSHPLARVGETLTKPDRDALRRDLLRCYRRYSIASGPGRSGFVKRQSARLNSIQKHAKKLAELLKADDADLRIIRWLWPISPERPAHLLPQMVFLVEMIDKMTGMQGKPGDIAERTNAHLGASGSALRWLANTLLPKVYSEHFGREARKSRNPYDGTLRGPYMRFARQVFDELKIDKVNAELVAQSHELAGIDDAIEVAKSRVAQAEGSAALERDRSDALQQREVLSAFADCLKRIDDALKVLVDDGNLSVELLRSMRAQLQHGSYRGLDG